MINKKQKLNGEYLKREYFAPNGRSAFFTGMQLLGLNKTKKILLPSYIGISKKEGSGVFDPVQKLGVKYDFYKLDKHLCINWGDLKKKLPKADVVLVIHYFGFCKNDMDKLVRLCKKYKKYLIEDCAHAFNSYYEGKKLGTFGDISFYSIHKFLATNDGGILRINNPDIDSSDLISDISCDTLEILYKSDIDKISKKRIENYNYICEKINGGGEELPEGIVPLNYPILIIDDDRNEVYFELKKRGIETVSLYHTLIPQIKKKEYPLSHYISQHILNLPIHEDITKKDIDKMIKETEDI